MADWTRGLGPHKHRNKDALAKKNYLVLFNQSRGLFKMEEEEYVPGKEFLEAMGSLKLREPSRRIRAQRLEKEKKKEPVISGETQRELGPVILAPSVGKSKTAPVIGALSRKDLFDAITLPRSGRDYCVREAENAHVLGEYLVTGRLGGESVAAEAHKVCRPYVCKNAGGCNCAEDSVRLAVKLIPFGSDIPGSARSAYRLIVGQHRGFHDPAVLMKVNWEHGVEITAMTLLNELVLQGICPNLPLMFRYFICDTCDLVNKALMNRDVAWTREYQKVYNKTHPTEELYSPTIGDVQEKIKELDEPLKNPCIVVVNELANGGDLQDWLPKVAETIRPEEVQSMAFQIIAGLYAMKKYFNMRHFDLHSGNVLIHNLPHKDGVLKYHIDDVDYYVPTYGRLFVIWDFGRVFVPGKMQAFASLGMYPDRKEKLRDMTQIAENIEIGLENSAGPLIATLAIPNKWVDYKNVFKDVFQVYTKVRKPVTSSWNMDKKLKRFKDKNLQRLVVPGMSEK